MGLFRLRPARDQAQESRVIVDLDKLVSEPQTFRWKGRTHRIRPISTQTFFELTEKVSALEKLNQPGVTKEDFVSAYTEVFQAACPTIKRKDVEEMEISQRGALLQFVLDCIRGRAQTEDEKKKTMNQGNQAIEK